MLTKIRGRMPRVSNKVAKEAAINDMKSLGLRTYILEPIHEATILNRIDVTVRLGLIGLHY